MFLLFDLTRFLSHTSYTYSAWLVVTLAVERFIVVHFPLRARSICTRKVATATVCILPVLIGLCYTYHFIAWQVNGNGRCIFVAKYRFITQFAFPWIFSSLYSYIPAVILVFCTTAICLQLARMKKRRAEMSSQQQSKANNELKVTIMGITICVLFICLTLPITLNYTILNELRHVVYVSPEMALVQTVGSVLGRLNFALNFFVYVMTSNKFRQEIKVLLCRRKLKAKKSSRRKSGTDETKMPSVSHATPNI
jgi:growth hormone secretagogue receptor